MPNGKKNVLYFNCRRAQKGVGTIDLQVTYMYVAKVITVCTAVCKTNVRLFHANCKTEVRYVRESQVASANSSLNKFVRDT